MNIQQQIEKCQSIIDHNKTCLVLLAKGDYVLQIHFSEINHYSICRKTCKNTLSHEDSYLNLKDALNDWNNIKAEPLGLNIDNVFTVIGKGLCMTTDLRKSIFKTDEYMETLPVKTGEYIEYQGKLHIIKQIELSRKGSKIHSKICLIVIPFDKI